MKGTSTDEKLEELVQRIKLTSNTKLTAYQLTEAFMLLRERWSTKSNIEVTIDVAIIKG